MSNQTSIGDIFGIETHEAFLKLPLRTAATYGGTSFRRVGYAIVEVQDQLYHYQYRPNNSSKNIIRNIFTNIGHPAGKGTDYMIHYKNPRIFNVIVK